MSTILLASAGIPDQYSARRHWRGLAELDRAGRHHLVDDPDAADIVLFTECHQLGGDWRLDTIRNTPIAQRHRDKVYVYDERDRPWCAFPGLYVSMPQRWFDPRFQAAWGYAASEPHVTLGLDAPPEGAPDLLVSFLGSPTHPVRRDIVTLHHPRGHFESVEGFLFHDWQSRDFVARRRRFAEMLFRSSFVMCPRGHGTSSIRLFEALAAGRVPVVISDEWVPPAGPDWQAISVRWPERGPFGALLDRLEELEQQAPEMGARGREAFCEWFARDVWFDRAADRLADLVARRAEAPFPEHGVRGRAFGRLIVAEAAGKVRHTAGRVRTRT